MKKITFSVFAICFTILAQSQKVGINVPVPSENLHVDSTIKIGKNEAFGAATPGRKNLIKFGDGDYLTIGEENRDDKLYVRYGDLIFFGSTSGVSTGRVGINTEQPSATLDLDGSFRLRGNGAAGGKVLTSDGIGNATWQTPANTNTGTGFYARLSNDVSLSDGLETDLTSFVEKFDDGGVFNPSNGRFTAPSSGVYQISFNMTFLELGTSDSKLRVNIKLNGGLRSAFDYGIPGLNLNFPVTYSNSIIMKLEASDYITLGVIRYQSGGSTLRGGSSTVESHFSAYKIY